MLTKAAVEITIDPLDRSVILKTKYVGLHQRGLQSADRTSRIGLQPVQEFIPEDGPTQAYTRRNPDEWLFEDWQLIARSLTAATHEDYRCYECDTIDALLGDIAHYWDLNNHELTAVIA